MLAFGLSVPIIVTLLVYTEQNALASLIEVHILYPIRVLFTRRATQFRKDSINLQSTSEPNDAEHLPLVALAGIIPFFAAGSGT